MGKRKYIETPEKMWEYFLAYKKEVKSNPILVQDYVGKDAEMVYRQKERPLTDKGFYNFCRRNIGCVKQYFDNQDKLYDEYCNKVLRQVEWFVINNNNQISKYVRYKNWKATQHIF